MRAASVVAQPGASGAGGSFAPAFSADGRFIVFVGHAPNLVTNGAPGLSLNVFVRDLAARHTELVSVSTNGLGSADADANFPSISSNGQFVAFASAAGNLVPGDTNRASDVFVRDRLAGTTTLVSADTNGLAPRASGVGSSRPILSADGRWVFFESLASSLVTNADGIETRDVFARDLQSGVMHLVSVNRTGTAALHPGEDSTLFSITPDGRFAAFVSKAPDLVSNVAPGAGELYVRDVQTGVTSWAGWSVAQSLGNAPVYLNAVLSTDGRFVAFKIAGATTNTEALVWRHDARTTNTVCLALRSRSDSWPDMTWDGRFIAYEDQQENATDVLLWETGGIFPIRLGGVARAPVITPDGRSLAFLHETNSLASETRLYVHDLIESTTRLASVTADGVPASVPATTVPALSPDGLRVAFESDWDGWVTNDLNGASDVFLRDLVAGTTELISERHAARPAQTGRGLSVASANGFSTDGRWLAFTSLDSNLAPGDTNNRADIFFHDLVAGTNGQLVLVPALNEGGASSGDTNPAIAWQTNVVSPPFFDGSGRCLAYVQHRGPLGAGLFTGPGVASGPWGGAIRWHDRQTGASRLVSVVPGGLAESDGRASAPAISTDGRLVAFQSPALDLLGSSGSKAYANVFLRDMAARQTWLISTNCGGSPVYGDAGSSNAVFTPDGRWLLFQSQAHNLATNYLTSPNVELFARELRLYDGTNAAGQTFTNVLGEFLTNYQVGPVRMLSLTLSAPLGCAGSAAVSADSRFIVFASAVNTNLVPVQGVYVHELPADSTIVPPWTPPDTNAVPPIVPIGTTWFVASNATAPALSGDGRFVVAHTWLPGSTNTFTNQVLLWDRTASTSELVSVNRAGTGGGDGPSTSPLITRDGRYVVFVSQASDLVANDANGVPDLFVRDRATSNTFAITLSIRTGRTGGGFSGLPVLGADGRTVIFNSFAGDLVDGDYNDRRDVFVFSLGAPDSDGDGLDDDWELAFFDTLARDGTGDFDDDGANDLQEFRAGTDPTNRSSVFRALTLRSLSGGPITLLWPAAPGRSYQVQFKDAVTAADWTELPAAVTVNGPTAWATDASDPLPAHRFYRVMIAP